MRDDSPSIAPEDSPTQRFWSGVSKEAVPISVGLVAIVVGVVISFQDAAFLRVLGTLLSTAGGILVSWVLGATYSVEKAIRERNERLEAMTRYLGTASSQISQAVASFRNGSLESETVLALIVQSNWNLSTIVADINALTGKMFEPASLIEAAKRLSELQSDFTKLTMHEDLGPNADQLAEWNQRLDSISALVTSAASPIKAVEPPTETLKQPCPDCGGQVSVSIGTHPGASAMQTCPACGSKFHVHRRGDGSIFTNRWGSTLGIVRSIDLNCPNPACRFGFKMNVGADSYGTVSRFCLNCGYRLEVDMQDGRVVSHLPTDINEGAVVGEEDQKATIQCYACGMVWKSFVLRDGFVYAVDNRCSKLVRASILPPGFPLQQYSGDTVAPETSNGQEIAEPLHLE